MNPKKTFDFRQMDWIPPTTNELNSELIRTEEDTNEVL